MKKAVLVLVLMGFAFGSQAVEVAGVQLPDEITLADQQSLMLNGAGVRKKFFLKVYVASLYLKQRSGDPLQIVATDTPKRVRMDMLYSKVDKKKFVEGWNEGFEANHSAQELRLLRDRIAQFNDMFETLVEGDRVLLDYLPGQGTRVTIKGVEKGVIPGRDFNGALLKIWLGESPVTESLKEALLGER